MGTPIRVLIVEDSTDDAELVLIELRRAGYDPVSERVQTAEAMKTALGREPWDLVVSDYTMPQFDAPAALNLLNQSSRDIPFIVVSGSIGEDIAVAMMRTGAHDYVLKQNLTRFVSAVQRELREAENRRQQKLTEQAKQQLQIERDELLERLKQENEDLAALTRVTANAISTLELDDLLRVLLERVMEVMHADTATILLAEGDELRVRASVGALNLSDSTHVQHVGQGFAGAVAQRLKPVYVEDAALDPLITDPLIREHGIRSMLGVPLKRNGNLIGVLHADWLAVRPCRDREVHLLEITAERCAAAIQNAQLYQEARRAAVALAESEARLRRIVDSNMIGLMFWDASCAITEANDAFLHIGGFTQDDIRARRVNWPDLTPPEYRELNKDSVRELAATGTCPPREREMFRKDGSRVPVLIGAATLPHQPGQGVAFVVDITERKQVEAALQAAEARYRALFEESPDGVLLIDAETGRTLEANEAAHKQLGYTREEFAALGPSDYEALETLEETRRRAQKVTAEGSDDFETLHRTKSGKIRNVHVWTKSLQLGERLAFHCIFEDITDRKQAEEALQALLREKEALLKEVHHRVKNNLQVITSLLRLETGRNEHPSTKSVLRDMQGRVQSMALLHETLYRSGTFASVDLGDYLKQLANHSFRALNAQPGLIQLDLDLASVRVDMDQTIPCGLLVNELISNCLKHGFPGGRTGGIRVELRPVDGGPQLRLRVSDTGVGLPPDFDSKRSHSLGLQLVSDLTRQIGGRLEIEPGPGAVFAVTFKAAEPTAATPHSDMDT